MISQVARRSTDVWHPSSLHLLDQTQSNGDQPNNDLTIDIAKAKIYKAILLDIFQQFLQIFLGSKLSSLTLCYYDDLLIFLTNLRDFTIC